MRFVDFKPCTRCRGGNEPLDSHFKNCPHCFGHKNEPIRYKFKGKVISNVSVGCYRVEGFDKTFRSLELCNFAIINSLKG